MNRDAQTLLPPNATALELALERLTRRLDAIDAPLASLIDPETCPANLLPWLAWAWSLDLWDEDWTEPVKRAAIAASFGLHRRKGTKGAILKALWALGMTADITEWQDQDPPGLVHTFNATVWAGQQLYAPADGAPVIDDRLTAKALAVVEGTKALRSDFTFQIGARFDRAIGAAVAASATAVTRQCARPDPALAAGAGIVVAMPVTPMTVCRTCMQGSLAA